MTGRLEETTIAGDVVLMAYAEHCSAPKRLRFAPDDGQSGDAADCFVGASAVGPVVGSALASRRVGRYLVS